VGRTKKKRRDWPSNTSSEKSNDGDIQVGGKWLRLRVVKEWGGLAGTFRGPYGWKKRRAPQSAERDGRAHKSGGSKGEEKRPEAKKRVVFSLNKERGEG